MGLTCMVANNVIISVNFDCNRQCRASNQSHGVPGKLQQLQGIMKTISKQIFTSVRFGAMLYLCYQLYNMLNVFCYPWLAGRRQALELSHVKKKFIDKLATQTCYCFTAFIGTLNNLSKR
jgi:hypothetical protein